MPASAARLSLADAIGAHARAQPADAALAAGFLALLADAGGVDPFLRDRLDGHFTASAFVVDASGTRTLLMHHRKLDRWLQPGGHADGDDDLAAVALREAMEETGLDGLVQEGGIFDLDRHRIPARGEVPAHWHFDVRYVVRAAGGDAFTANHESLALAWRDIADVAGDDAIDGSVRRMARRWLARGVG